MQKLGRYLKNWLVVMDIAFNVLFLGSCYETISERAWRRQWGVLIIIIDSIFYLLTGEVYHCQNSSEGNEAQYEIY